MNEIRYGRKRSGIKKQLQNKLNSWLESIDDPVVQKLASENVIVTGGSIASMLLGEKVNDYDVYFRDIKTTKAVAEYYVKKFLEKNEGYDIEVRRETIKNIKDEEEDRVTIFVSSGGVASDEDIQTDYMDQEDQPEPEENGSYKPIFLSQNAITLSDKFQIVIRFYGEPDQIHRNYDFVHAMNYYDFKENHLELKPEALECLLSRTLVYRGSLYPIASLFRTKKFIERGWRISAGEQLKIAWQISELDLTNKAVLREQLTGVDQAYLTQLINALEQIDDKDKLNSTYVGSIIDKIFGE